MRYRDRDCYVVERLPDGYRNTTREPNDDNEVRAITRFLEAYEKEHGTLPLGDDPVPGVGHVVFYRARD